MNQVLRRATLAAALFLAGLVLAEPAKGPYEVKSGVYESTILGGKDVVYFDDFGRRQAKYSTIELGGPPSHKLEVRLPDGTVYSVDLDEKTGTKLRIPPEAAQVMAAAMAPHLMKDAKVKKLEPRTYVGRKCQGLEAEAMGLRARTWTWKGILLHSETGGAGTDAKPIVMDVTKLTEGPVPGERFVVPADVAIQDLTAQQPSAR